MEIIIDIKTRKHNTNVSDHLFTLKPPNIKMTSIIVQKLCK